MSLYTLGTQLTACLLQSPESSIAVRNIGFGGKEMHLGSPSPLSVSLVLIALTSVKIFDLPDGCFPHV